MKKKRKKAHQSNSLVLWVSIEDEKAKGRGKMAASAFGVRRMTSLGGLRFLRLSDKKKSGNRLENKVALN